MHADVVIVGAGHGGAQCAVALRQNGFAGTIKMIGREPEPPYERPPLSKEYLAREKPFERLYIRAPDFWRDKEVDLILSTEVVGVDPVKRTLDLSDGTSCTYGSLIWAAGGDPRMLTCKGADLAGVYAVRTRADCDSLMQEIDNGAENFVIIGGGYIGLEAAAVLRKLERNVTLLEAMPRVLARVAGPEIAAFFEDEHRRHGVDLRTGIAVTAVEGEGRVGGVRLGDGQLVPADVVIVGIGIDPAVGPLAAAGAECRNGVIIDRLCRTSLPDIYAIGDCAAFACHFADDAIMRVESVQNANDQATCVAKAICGEPVPYAAFPWFWSNQYDLKLQTAGISAGYDDVVVRGSPADRTFSLIYLKQGRIIALDCVSRVKDYVQGRKLVEAGAVVARDSLADTEVPLAEHLRPV